MFELDFGIKIHVGFPGERKCASQSKVHTNKTHVGLIS